MKKLLIVPCILLLFLTGCGKVRIKTGDYIGVPLLQKTRGETIAYIQYALEDGYSDENGTPELTDEFCRTNFNAASVEELITRTKERLDYYSYADQIMELMLERSSVSGIPEEEIEERAMPEYDSFMKRVRETAQTYNVSEETVLRASGYADTEALMEDCRKEASDFLSYRYVMLRIAELEKLSFSDTEMDSEIDAYARSNGFAGKEEFIAAVGEEEVRESFLMEMVLRFIIDHAVIF